MPSCAKSVAKVTFLNLIKHKNIKNNVPFNISFGTFLTLDILVSYIKKYEKCATKYTIYI